MPPTPPKAPCDVFQSGMPALAEIRAAKGEAVARAVLVVLVKDMLSFFNTAQPMNDAQVAMTVELALETYPYMQPDDVELCFRNAMKGRYGKVYNRIDGQIVMEWLREYDKERAHAAESIAVNEHKARMASEDAPPGGMTYGEYREELRRLTAEGDEEAGRRLRLSDAIVELAKQKSA